MYAIHISAPFKGTSQDHLKPTTPHTGLESTRSRVTAHVSQTFNSTAKQPFLGVPRLERLSRGYDMDRTPDSTGTRLNQPKLQLLEDHLPNSSGLLSASTVP